MMQAPHGVGLPLHPHVIIHAGKVVDPQWHRGKVRAVFLDLRIKESWFVIVYAPTVYLIKRKD